ncbi:hypothetical protein CKAH01_17933 [Colletotrichum kahawae]|uniref:Uncharacterized protein n=1 Tax=Colletotrichum kahawae TaxID=34407 RepID=A0AAD9YA33_COLKA|nr:hypothetical protein CKAH01_17933 [Colletotrichum kahawae]
MARHFKLSHLFPLFVAVAHTLGGIVPFFAEDAGIRSFGLSERFADSSIAQACFVLDGARLSVLGMVQLCKGLAPRLAVCYGRIVDPAEPDLGNYSGKAGDLGRALARDITSPLPSGGAPGALRLGPYYGLSQGYNGVRKPLLLPSFEAS